MINFKDVKKNIDSFKKKINERNANVEFDELIKLDKSNRELILKKESLEQEKKILSKTKNESNFQKSKELSEKISSFSKDQNIIQKKINLILSNIPNIALDEVPVGKDEKSNKIIKKEGTLKKFDFPLKSHIELGEKDNLCFF